MGDPEGGGGREGAGLRGRAGGPGLAIITLRLIITLTLAIILFDRITGSYSVLGGYTLALVSVLFWSGGLGVGFSFVALRERVSLHDGWGSRAPGNHCFPFLRVPFAN